MRMGGNSWPEMACHEHLFCSFIVAGRAAGFAVHEPIGTDASIDYGLAEAAVLLALATAFGLFALRAAILCRAGSCAHKCQCNAWQAADET